MRISNVKSIGYTDMLHKIINANNDEVYTLKELHRILQNKGFEVNYSTMRSYVSDNFKKINILGEVYVGNKIAMAKLLNKRNSKISE